MKRLIATCAGVAMTLAAASAMGTVIDQTVLRDVAVSGPSHQVRISGKLSTSPDQGADGYGRSATQVPEPGTMLLLGTSSLCLAIYVKRRKNA